MKKSFVRLPENLTPEARNAFRAGLIMVIASALLDPFYFYLAYQSGAWQLYTFAISIIVFAFLMLAATLVARRGQSSLSAFLILGGLFAIIVLISSLITGLGLVLAAGGVLVTVFLSAQMLPPKSTSLAIVISIAVGLLALFIDLFNLVPARLSVPALDIFIPIVAIVFVAIFGVTIVRQFRDYSLRTKQIVAFVAVALVSITVVGFVSTSISSAQIDEQAGSGLVAIAQGTEQQVASQLEADLNILITLALNKFVQDSVAAANAVGISDQTALERLDQQWVNANDSDPLIQGVIHNDLAGEFQEFQAQFPDYLEIFVTDKYGAVIAATNRTSDYYQADEDWWQQAWNKGEGAAYISQPTFDESANATAVNMAQPVVSHAGTDPIGVLRLTVSVARYTVFHEDVELGQTGHADLIFAGNQHYETETRKIAPLDPDEAAALTALLGTFGEIVYKGKPSLVGLEPVSAPLSSYEDHIAQLGWSVIVHQDISEAQQVVTTTTRGILMAAVFITIVIALVALGASQFLTGPLVRLTAVAEQVTAGDLSAQAQVESKDETGALATAFNTMTAQFRDLISSLEGRVAERTRNLELASEVGRAVSRVRALDVMLKDAVELIRSQFDLSYVQVYLTDPSQANLILQSGTGSVGEQLLSRAHRLSLNTASINGRAAVEKKSVVISDTSMSATFRPNPLLPDIRSEMAVPLMIGDRVVGVLDMQSERAGSLNEEVLPAFETLAGQLAIAIQNTSLVAELEEARVEIEKQAARLTRANWQDYLDAVHQPEKIGFLFDQNKVIPLTETEKLQLPAGNNTLAAPISVAGESLGALIVELDQERQSAHVTELINIVSRQVAQHVESLRLLDSAERYRAEAEQALRRLTREGWQAQTTELPVNGYVYANNQVKPLSQAENGAQTPGAIQPLKVRGEDIGTLELPLPEGGTALDAEAADLVAAVAEVLTAHIENLRLANATEKALFETQLRTEELALLNEMGQALTAQTSTDGVVKTVYEFLSRMMDTNEFYLAFYEEASDEIVFALTASGEKMRWYEERRQAGHGITEYIIRHRQPLFMPDRVEQRLEELGITGYGKIAESWLGAPLILGGRVLGVIGLESYTTPRLYTEQHLNMLTAVANQATIAIENTRLLEGAQKRAEREALINTINQKIQSATSVESALETAAREIGHLLKARRAVVEIGTTPQNGQ